MPLRGLLSLVLASGSGSWPSHCARNVARARIGGPSRQQWSSRTATPTPTQVLAPPWGVRRRGMHTSTVLRHEQIVPPEPGQGIKVHFRDSKGASLRTIEAREGDNILDLAHEYDVDLEGACEGSVACSTCHVILTPEHYDMLPEPEDDENDMLDMAFGLTDTSRLGCQVKLTRELDGIVVTLPSATRNMFVDGSKPTKH